MEGRWVNNLKTHQSLKTTVFLTAPPVVTIALRRRATNERTNDQQTHYTKIMINKIFEKYVFLQAVKRAARKKKIRGGSVGIQILR